MNILANSILTNYDVIIKDTKIRPSTSSGFSRNNYSSNFHERAKPIPLSGASLERKNLEDKKPVYIHAAKRVSTSEPKTKILVKKTTNQNEKNKVNYVINEINHFLSLISKNKDPNCDIKTLNEIIYKLGIVGKQKITIATLKSKEFIQEIKAKLLRVLHNTINKANGIKLEGNKEVALILKYFIGEGNNSTLVNSVMKERLVVDTYKRY